jgi:molybdopterin-guanine dinucleotide biosynthesis protein MobB
MTIKHGSHTFNIDPASTDTYRHYHEGNAERVAMVAPDKFALVMRWNEELTAEQVAERYMSDADIVICEGFKASELRRIEVYRRVAHAQPLYGQSDQASERYLALVTDVPSLQLPIPIFSLDEPQWLERLATLVEQEIMQRNPGKD